jgi:hypothetical protein
MGVLIFKQLRLALFVPTSRMFRLLGMSIVRAKWRTLNLSVTTILQQAYPRISFPRNQSQGQRNCLHRRLLAVLLHYHPPAVSLPHLRQNQDLGMVEPRMRIIADFRLFYLHLLRRNHVGGIETSAPTTLVLCL